MNVSVIHDAVFAYGCASAMHRGIGKEQMAGIALLQHSRDFHGEHARQLTRRGFDCGCPEDETVLE
jgi:hypothetical protein